MFEIEPFESLNRELIQLRQDLSESQSKNNSYLKKNMALTQELQKLQHLIQISEKKNKILEESLNDKVSKAEMKTMELSQNKEQLNVLLGQSFYQVSAFQSEFARIEEAAKHREEEINNEIENFRRALEQREEIIEALQNKLNKKKGDALRFFEERKKFELTASKFAEDNAELQKNLEVLLKKIAKKDKKNKQLLSELSVMKDLEVLLEEEKKEHESTKRDFGELAKKHKDLLEDIVNFQKNYEKSESEFNQYRDKSEMELMNVSQAYRTQLGEMEEMKMICQRIKEDKEECLKNISQDLVYLLTWLDLKENKPDNYNVFKSNINELYLLKAKIGEFFEEFKNVKKEMKDLIKTEKKLHKNIKLMKMDIIEKYDEKHQADAQTQAILEDYKQKLENLEGVFVLRENNLKDALQRRDEEVENTKKINDNLLEMLKNQENEANVVIQNLKDEINFLKNELVAEKQSIQRVYADKEHAISKKQKELERYTSELQQQISANDLLKTNIREMELHGNELSRAFERLKKKAENKDKKLIELKAAIKIQQYKEINESPRIYERTNELEDKNLVKLMPINKNY